MLSLLIFLAVLSILVLGHEFGHYMAARICGVKADEFGYGFPPRALGFVRVNGKWKRVSAKDQGPYKNTIWSLNWLPLGGFVRLKGEEGEIKGETDSFASKKVLPRLFILAAGVMMNWLIAIVIFSIAFSVGVPTQTEGLPQGAVVRDKKVQIMEIVDKSPAQMAGIQAGDFLVSINGTRITGSSQAQTLLHAQAENQPVALTLLRGQQEIHLSAQEKYLESVKRMALGVSLSDTGIVRFPIHQAIIQGCVTTFIYTKFILFGLGALVRDLFVQHRLSADVSGPIGIAVMTGQIARQGIWSLAQFTALLSINLAIINFLPIPALDGGRALFIVIEAIRRRKASPLIEATIHRIGFALLLILIVLVTTHDLFQYGGVIWNGLRQAVGL
ncbi:RIP metalloprotease [Candidatus Uhrbacteria bacterium]|nr:RIP metalloprotease [Candidatus Uhrbacteria bacterium]